jgi:hypothetical protein
MIRSLTRLEERWACAALSAIYPGGGEERWPLGIRQGDVEGFLRDLFARVPLLAALGLRAAIWIVALAPIFLMGRLVTVMRLSSHEQQALLATLSSSSSYAVRQLILALKASGGMLFGAALSVRGIGPRPSVFPDASSSPSLISTQALVRRK